jgi:hypothetical protein
MASSALDARRVALEKRPLLMIAIMTEFTPNAFWPVAVDRGIVRGGPWGICSCFNKRVTFAVLKKKYQSLNFSDHVARVLSSFHGFSFGALMTYFRSSSGGPCQARWTFARLREALRHEHQFLRTPVPLHHLGESHGPALGAVVDGCPPGLPIDEGMIQPYLDARRPGQSRFTTQRQEPDQVKILSGVFEGRTTGTPISLMIENTDQRSKDYSEVAKAYRPGHADYAYDAKYGFRDYRGGGRSSARETAARVAAGGVARLVIPEVTILAWVSAIGGDAIDMANFDAAQIGRNPFFCPDASAAARWEGLVDQARKAGLRWARWSNAWPPGWPAGARRSMPSSTPNWPMR